MPNSQIEQFISNSAAASKVIEGKAAGYNVIGDPRPAVTNFVSQRQINIRNPWTVVNEMHPQPMTNALLKHFESDFAATTVDEHVAR